MSTDTTAQEQRGPRSDVSRRPRLRGEERDRIRAEIAEGYPGASIRLLAAEHGMSFGLVRTLLLEAGVELRPSRRCPRATEQ